MVWRRCMRKEAERVPKFNLPGIKDEKKKEDQQPKNYAVAPGQFSTMYYDDNGTLNPNTNHYTNAGANNPVYHPNVSTTTATALRGNKTATPAATPSGGGNGSGGGSAAADYKGMLDSLYNKVMGYESYQPGSYNPSTFTPETYTPTTYTPSTYTPLGFYTPSTYSPTTYYNTVDTSGTQAMLDTALSDIRNYDDFQYDLNGDLLYRQMVDNYTMLGKQAMSDAMGQAAALTGGYGNSYAAGVGNQAYQQHLTQVNNQIPAFQQAALGVWQSGYDRLQNDYAAISQQLANLLSIEDMNFNIWNANEANRFNAWSANEANAFNAWNANEQLNYNAWNANENNAFNAWNANEQNAANAFLNNQNNLFNAWAQNEQNAYNSWLSNEQLKQDAWLNNYNQLMDQYNTGVNYIGQMQALEPKTYYTSSGSKKETAEEPKKTTAANSDKTGFWNNTFNAVNNALAQSAAQAALTGLQSPYTAAQLQELINKNKKK